MTGTIRAGTSATQTLIHSSQAASTPTASMKLINYSATWNRRNSRTKSSIKIAGLITPYSDHRIVLRSNFALEIGGVAGYNLSIPASQFKVRTFEEHKVKKTNYFYHHGDTDVFISDSGSFEVKTSDVNLSALNNSQLSYIGVVIDSTQADARVSLRCDENVCNLRPIRDHEYHDHRNRIHDHGGHR